MPTYYYGVQGGPRPGVYLTWPEASAQSTGVAGARSKKFPTRADAEAFAGVGAPPAGGASGRTYLDCPFGEKDSAKQLGARWDADQRAWYVEPGRSLAPFARWLTGASGGGPPAPAAPPAQPPPPPPPQLLQQPRREQQPAAAASRQASGGAGTSGSVAACFAQGGSAAAAELHLFTDGACKGNQNVHQQAQPAGCGVVVVEGCVGVCGGHATAELFGPVVLDARSPLFLGAEVRARRRRCARG